MSPHGTRLARPGKQSHLEPARRPMDPLRRIAGGAVGASAPGSQIPTRREADLSARFLTQRPPQLAASFVISKSSSGGAIFRRAISSARNRSGCACGNACVNSTSKKRRIGTFDIPTCFTQPYRRRNSVMGPCRVESALAQPCRDTSIGTLRSAPDGRDRHVGTRPADREWSVLREEGPVPDPAVAGPI
jgi:hypothetical protein